MKLIAYLETFHTDNEDPQFVDEKRLLIEYVIYIVLYSVMYSVVYCVL